MSEKIFLTVFYSSISFFVTIGFYLFFRRFQEKYKKAIFNPTLLTIVCISTLLLALKIPYPVYYKGGQWLSDMLGLAVVSLGLPMYEQVCKSYREIIGIVSVVVISSALSLCSVTLLALMAGLSDRVAISLSLKSVTTPVAILISENIGGLPSLTSIAVILTGLTGAVFGVQLLSLFKITTPEAREIAMGASCHVLGVARISEETLCSGGLGALTVVLSSCISSIQAPLIVPRLVSLFGG